MPRSRNAAPELNHLRQRIDAWRVHRRGRSMPGELWDASARAASELGVSHVATALGLGYAPLKSRVMRGDPATFVELPGAKLLSPLAGDGLKIELTRGETRLSITAPVSGGVDVAAVVSAFLRG